MMDHSENDVIHHMPLKIWKKLFDRLPSQVSYGLKRIDRQAVN